VIPTGIRLGARTLGARRRLSIRQWQENAFFCETGISGELAAPRGVKIAIHFRQADGWTLAGIALGCRPMPNSLIHETSPYLLQHAHNPVDWQAWGEAAFEQARAEDKLVFLSIGYSTCHWCHVMERESFENERVAEVMNHHFINVKVDREERPDIDATYMAFVQATTGQGGWPMSVWLTPDGKPVVGGTYFPPEDRQGRAGFTRV
jgi:hypothetical protein